MGVPLRTLYGQTELLGAYTLHPFGKVDPDTTGVPMADDIEIRIDNPDIHGVGEIVVRHPNMFLGYYKNPEASAADMKDGWMHSGDAGYFNDNKQLVVIDRIKDLAETARGERFSPQYHREQAEILALHRRDRGAGRRPRRAGGDDLHPLLDHLEMGGEEPHLVHHLYRPRLAAGSLCAAAQGGRNRQRHAAAGAAHLAFLLLYKELDADDGELTRTRKVRRSVINEKYAGIIDAIYGGERDIPIDTVIRFQDGTTQRIRTTLAVVDLAATGCGGRGMSACDACVMPGCPASTLQHQPWMPDSPSMTTRSRSAHEHPASDPAPGQRPRGRHALWRGRDVVRADLQGDARW